MDNIEWGAPIPVDGKRPAWLRDDDDARIWNARKMRNDPVGDVDGYYWSEIREIRLLADHFAYTAIARGFEPWGGGDEAPEDWDGGEVLYASGHVNRAHYDDTFQWRGGAIIGYRRRVDAAGDTVTIARMTEAEAAKRFNLRTDRESDYSVGAFFILRELRLIFPPTPAERIAAETGVALADVKKVLVAQ